MPKHSSCVVRRNHRTQAEFYAVHELDGDLEDLTRELSKWECVYNDHCPQPALGNLSTKKV